MLRVKVSVQDSKACEKILTVEVDSSAVQKEYDEFYKAIAPQAKVPGFRPGKAPREVLMMHYQGEAQETVLKNLISDSYRQAVSEKALEPLGHPRIQDVHFHDSHLTYKACIEVRPKIKLSRITGLSAKKEAAAVKTEEIDQSLNYIRESLAQYKAVEDRPAQMGDFVIADYVCLVEGKEADKRNDDWFELREEEFLKGFSSQLAGIRPGEEREVRVTFPENAQRQEFSGKPAVFKIKAKELKLKILPELNDDLAKDAGDYQTLAELKSKIEKDLLARKEQEKETQFENALLDELLKHNKIDLPSGLVERRLSYLMEKVRHDFMSGGRSEEDFEKEKGNLETKLEPEARRQVHLAFLLDEIAVKEGIQVLEEELKEKYNQFAQRYKQPVEQIEKYYMQKEEALDALRDQIRNEKTIEFLKKNAKVK